MPSTCSNFSEGCIDSKKRVSYIRTVEPKEFS